MDYQLYAVTDNNPTLSYFSSHLYFHLTFSPDCADSFVFFCGVCYFL